MAGAVRSCTADCAGAPWDRRRSTGTGDVARGSADHNVAHHGYVPIRVAAGRTFGGLSEVPSFDGLKAGRLGSTTDVPRKNG